MDITLQTGYNQATQIHWTGKRGNAPRPWPNGGNPMDVHDSTIPVATIERFWAKVDKSAGPDACWPWTASRNPGSYGRVSHFRRTAYAHRVAYEIAIGPIPAGDHYGTMCVCHRCDNKICCNPAHLWLGTVSDNNADRDAKGRQVAVTGDRHGSRTHPERVARGDRNGSRLHPDRHPRGERQGIAKLTESDVHLIRAAVARGESGRDIAPRFGVSFSQISRVARGAAWAHVPRRDP